MTKSTIKHFGLWCGVLAVGLVGVALLLSRQTGDKLELPDYPRVVAQIGGEEFTFLKTQTAQQSALGLGAVPKLPARYGMLFYGQGQMGFWMKGMTYPIDMVWLDSENTVVHVVHDAQPNSYPKTVFVNPPETDARIVIEITAGEAKRLQIEPGMKILL